MDPLNPDYYRRGSVDPIAFALDHGLGFCEGAIIKYVVRYKEKGGSEDLKKARTFLNRLIRHQVAQERQDLQGTALHTVTSDPTEDVLVEPLTESPTESYRVT